MNVPPIPTDESDESVKEFVRALLEYIRENQTNLKFDTPEYRKSALWIGQRWDQLERVMKALEAEPDYTPIRYP